jgi:hypothetical protein
LSARADHQQAPAEPFLDMFVFAPLFIGGLDRQLYLYLARIFAVPGYDLITRRRIHPADYVALLACPRLLPDMRLRIGASAAWHRFSTWLVT